MRGKRALIEASIGVFGAGVGPAEVWTVLAAALNRETSLVAGGLAPQTTI